MLGFWDYLLQTKKPEELVGLREEGPVSSSYGRTVNSPYYQIAPPTGGGNKEAMAKIMPYANAASKKGNLVPSPATPGMEDKKVKKRVKDAKKIGGY